LKKKNNFKLKQRIKEQKKKKMAFIFGKQKTPKEILREHQRNLNRSIREIEKETNNLKNQEKKIIIDIKKNAKDGQMGAVKIMAKDLVRTRNQIQKFIKMRAELQAVSLRIVTMKSQQTMAEAMKGVTRAMMMMNRQMNLPAMQRIMMEFEKQNERMDMKQEMMSDTMDDVFEGEGEEEETEEVISKVLDEIGINLKNELVDAPTQKTSTATKADDAELLNRLDNLRKS